MARPITENCQRIFNSRTHICFGISPFNSYFSPEKIKEIARWGNDEFESMHFFIPDVPSSYTFEALGYSHEDAVWKARRQAQGLFNKITKALAELGYSYSDAQDTIINWDYLQNNQRFLELHASIHQLFLECEKFRNDCRQASSWVLNKRVGSDVVLSEQIIDSGTRYLLAEIPLFLDAAGILGVEGSVFSYHQCIPFIENILHGKYDHRPSVQQGFLIFEGTKADNKMYSSIEAVL